MVRIKDIQSPNQKKYPKAKNKKTTTEIKRDHLIDQMTLIQFKMTCAWPFDQRSMAQNGGLLRERAHRITLKIQSQRSSETT